MKTKCQKCQTTNPDHARFCQKCGVPLAATCVQNRTVIMSGSSTGTKLPTVDAEMIKQKTLEAFETQPNLQGVGAFTTDGLDQREHLIAAIDRSASMAQLCNGGMSKLDAAKRAAVAMICNKALIDPNDKIGLVVFNSQAEVLMDPQPISSHKKQMIQAIQGLTDENGTDINQPLVKAFDMFDWCLETVVRRIVLLTDGEGGQPIKTAQKLKSKGVVIDVIGVGSDTKSVNEKLLKKVASVVDGELRYRFIKDQQTLIAHYTQLANKTATGV